MTPMTGLEHADLLSDDAVIDPYPLLAALREHDPVHWSTRYRSWFVTRYDDVTAALRDPRFSSDRIAPYRRAKLDGPDADPELRAAFGVLEDWMVFKDPPDHRRLRRLLARAFTPRAVALMAPRVRVIADELLDDVLASGSGEADLVRDFAYPLTASVIAEMLGVPRQDREQFKDWSDQITGLVFGGLGNTSRHDAGARGMRELTDYLGRLVADHEQHPADDLLTAMISARDDRDALTPDEVIATGVLLLFAGHETTTSLIGTGLLALLGDPDQRGLVTGTLGDGAVDELLRFDGPAKTVARVLVDDVELRGRSMHRGDRVFLSPASANRDPSVFERPDVLDLTRDGERHLGFGIGAHFCLGAPLARLETGVAVPLALERLPRLRVAATPRWHPVLLSRGMERFPVRFDVG
jgi:cytochrome P450